MPGEFNSRSEVAMGFMVGFQKKMYTTMLMIRPQCRLCSDAGGWGGKIGVSGWVLTVVGW
jgi:hypothetical protein